MAAAAGYPEALLHYAWQHRRYDATSLLTTDRQPITVVHTGHWNRDAGPDFLNATVRIGKLEFHGHIELHVHGDDWYQHRHNTDPAYNPVILHVVGQGSTQPPHRQDGTPIPEVILGERLDPQLLIWHGKLAAAIDRLPCAAFFPEVPELPKRMWVQSQGHQRLLAKAESHRAAWETAHRDWRQALWGAFLGAMGGPQNRSAFEEIARRVTYAIAAKHRQDPLALEALLFGAAAMLEQPEDTFCHTLAQHWAHFQRLYSLDALAPGSILFGRMRPASFPSLRLAQVAAIARQPLDWLGLLTAPVAELRTWLMAAPDAYFQHHYKLAVPSKPHQATLGEAQIRHLLINTLIPFAALYHQARGDQAGVEAAAERLASIPAEQNRITGLYKPLGFTPQTALESQGLIELHRHYCTPKRCLQCTIGHHVLKRSS